ncbi:MAG TPA: putative zinc-binding metallopeptidase [Planctomycetota bacterium]|nr:putative zinc-binding metallopeptidase [Planctomycetota bacterium]
MAAKEPFRESNWSTVPIRDLGLTIEGTRLEPVLDEFTRELDRAGIRVRPRYYLSTEWGVLTGTVTIAIPFYLARPELTDLHGSKVGYFEGVGRAELLRYLRHEMGHVVNYAYRLYDQEEWVKLFGPITRPYLEEYRPSPFSRRYVRHLPGWYAQKHPDEDWAETFAVWMTPGRDWREEYADQPMALAKLTYCDRTMVALREVEPLETASTIVEDVGELPYSVDQYYGAMGSAVGEFPHGLEGALRAIFEDLGAPEDGSDSARKPASQLIRGMERELMSNVYRWTGHFPERTRALVRHLAERADQLGQVSPAGSEDAASMAVTTLVTALAMNHVHQGSYLPEAQPEGGAERASEPPAPERDTLAPQTPPPAGNEPSQPREVLPEPARERA